MSTVATFADAACRPPEPIQRCQRESLRGGRIGSREASVGETAEAGVRFVDRFAAVLKQRMDKSSTRVYSLDRGRRESNFSSTPCNVPTSSVVRDRPWSSKAVLLALSNGFYHPARMGLFRRGARLAACRRRRITRTSQGCGPPRDSLTQPSYPVPPTLGFEF